MLLASSLGSRLSQVYGMPVKVYGMPAKALLGLDPSLNVSSRPHWHPDGP